MLCPKCGKELQETVMLCTTCGWKSQKWERTKKKGKAQHISHIFALIAFLVIIILGIVSILVWGN